MRRLLSPGNKLLHSQKASFSQMSKFQNSFLSPTNLKYIESLYEQWVVDKNSVSPSFAAYFDLLERGQDPESAFEKPENSSVSGLGSKQFKDISKQIKMRMMIDTYRSIGHHFSKIDPLYLEQHKQVHGKVPHHALSTSEFGYEKDELEESIVVKNLRGEGSDNGPYTIKQFQEWLSCVYCDKVGFEYMHILNKEERDFIKTQLEEKIQMLRRVEPTKEEQLSTLRRLAKDQSFVDFLGSKFSNFRRYGVEGLNSGTTALNQLVESAAEAGVENVVFGMAHRGRLNALHCVLKVHAQDIWKEFFEKTADGDNMSFAGDVKYHLGRTNKREINGKQISLTMLSNPSHLEAVNPCVYGSTRAIQEIKKDKNKVLGVIVHGDAAMTGQGVVYESLGFQDLVDYSPGGIIHIVYNNQIGFTTPPKQGRSSYYCTEIAKAVDAPVIHVNADVPDILGKIIKIAVAYRQKFNKDIFIDIVGYRRYGHNEQDQPAFTQPKIYEKIKEHPTCYDFYSQKLLQRGVVTEQDLKNLKNQFWNIYEEDYKKVLGNEKVESSPPYVEEFTKIRPPPALWGPHTGVNKDVLTKLFKKITTWPADFNIHPTIKRIYQERIKTFNNDEPLDWATMQKLSWATLLEQGYDVRISGEDVERGTFSHRHALISDQKRDVEKHVFLKSISNSVRITNSHLSEYGVLGFEYGYSITNPNSLVIWQAQFGDFSNGAAITIDNFIVSGQTKWKEQSGIVLSLPHGMDGQGPEHSQGRIQRFLQLSDDVCDENQSMTMDQQLRSSNIQVVYCSTTANYFHALRRQLHRNFRKPLIAFNSKKLLKYKGANLPISTVTEGTNFTYVYPDTETSPSKVKKVLFCSGQFYYELKNKREENKRDDIAIIRIEQLAPFPHEDVKKAVSAYGSNVEYFFAQEEHENYGVWNFVYPRLKYLLKKHVGYFGRTSSAATAVGASKIHKQEEAELLAKIFSS